MVNRNGTSRPSTNETPTAISQNAAAAANGNLRRATSGSAISAAAGTQNQSVVLGAPSASSLKTSWSIAAIAKSTIKRSNP